MNTVIDPALEALKYPIGRRDPAARAYTPERVSACLEVLTAFPERLRAVVKDLSDTQLALHYRPGGWTLRQVVHHLADSHMHALVRVKWALTEEEPTIKAYAQDRWAETADASTAPVGASLDILAGVHARLCHTLRSLGQDDMRRGFVHPEQQRRVDLGELVEIYTWHGAHHLAHITGALERAGA